MTTQRQFTENTILWIKDEWKRWEGIAELIVIKTPIINEFGNCKITTINIDDEVEDEVARINLDAMIQQVGNEPYLINVRTAQLARTYLEQYIPGAIICDSNFPLNGKAVVGWLKAHGLDNYPLIGYSGRDFKKDDLGHELFQFFTETSARYIQKMSKTELDGRDEFDKIAEGCAFSRRYVMLMKDRQ